MTLYMFLVYFLGQKAYVIIIFYEIKGRNRAFQLWKHFLLRFGLDFCKKYAERNDLPTNTSFLMQQNPPPASQKAITLKKKQNRKILILAKIMISARIKKNPGWHSEPGPGPDFFSIKIRRPGPGLGAFQIKSAAPDPGFRASGLLMQASTSWHVIDAFL